ncbi:substrate-binding domain-containing protein [Arthrobacter sp. KNU40]|uniref:substrate-binding domain-containing protein n=1 Tax=Arthrobacter sp. KNU40 TaxID=3447965 RepID=UPI003F6171F6
MSTPTVAWRKRLLPVAATLLLAGTLAACGSSGGNGSSSAGKSNDPPWCGTKPITVGYAAGLGGNAWVDTSVAVYKNEAAKCSNITRVLDTNANADPQAAISQFNSLVAQGATAVVVLNGTGQALVPAVKSASARGVAVGIDMSGFAPDANAGYCCGLIWDTKAAGRSYATWMAKALKGKGRVIVLGGAAGQPSFDAMWDGVKEVFANYPDIKLVPDHWVATSEAQGQAQQAVAAQLANGPIDGVITDYADTAIGAMQAFQASGVPIPPIATNEQNRLGCEWETLHKSNPNFELYAASSLVEAAAQTLHMAVEQAQGIKSYSGDTAYDSKPFWDSLSADKKPACDQSYPQQAFMSGGIDAATAKKILGN